MFRWLIVPLYLFPLSLSAQVSNDSLQKILVGTEAQVKYYSKNPKLFTPVALASISFHLEILKSVNTYQDKSRPYFKKVRTIDSCFNLLKIRTNYMALDSTETEKIIFQIERTFKKEKQKWLDLKSKTKTFESRITI